VTHQPVVAVVDEHDHGDLVDGLERDGIDGSTLKGAGQ
jgi:hypothetical protein